MLLITRRTGEGIVINGSIEVKILEVRGGRVKLGFEYPLGNTVYRQEVYAKIQDENRAAAQGLQPEALAGGKLGTVLASVGKPQQKEAQSDEQHRSSNRLADRGAND